MCITFEFIINIFIIYSKKKNSFQNLYILIIFIIYLIWKYHLPITMTYCIIILCACSIQTKGVTRHSKTLL